MRHITRNSFKTRHEKVAFCIGEFLGVILLLIVGLFLLLVVFATLQYIF